MSFYETGGTCELPQTSNALVAFTDGNYAAAIRFLTELASQYGEHAQALLARSLCYQQQREFIRVLADTSKVIKLYALNDYNTDLFCQMLALWLRSLAFESLEKWQEAKQDLNRLKTLILQQNNSRFTVNGTLSLFISNMVPLINQIGEKFVAINLQCVTERLHRMMHLEAQEISRNNNATQAFRLIDRVTKNFNDLTQIFQYRLLLRMPIHSSMHLDRWYSLDLMCVSEMGLFKRTDMEGIEGYKLGCKILEIGKRETSKYEVKVRAMSQVSCEWSDVVATEWAGVQSNGKGGLEIKLTRMNDNDSTSKVHRPDNATTVNNGRRNRKSTKKNSFLYLHIFPILEMISDSRGNKLANNNHQHLHRLVPLVIGPIKVTTCESQPSSCGYHYAVTQSTKSTTVSACHSNSYTSNWSTFELAHGKNLLIKELWDFGIPGKVWDSAFIIAGLFKNKILQDPRALLGKSILDLSTGTGFLGLYLAALLAVVNNNIVNSNKQKGARVILTDLEDALKLVRVNHSLNQYLFKNDQNVSIKVDTLKWGDSNKAKKLELFDKLIQTFVDLCVPGRTKMYLGYKRRGLSIEQELEFFSKLNSKFNMKILEGGGNLENETQVRIYELSREK
ncbi:9587_t:CDS:2 [Ambispora gerdemannii]|uniref:9587_t:CDS:1 n=1 Tax=Ambispora gerdemannii TaxID=144530 RepID=A0A9N8ZR91_9GLOM|nr:9587_t:CDS:2 [Ambispora gerdemannii]